MCVSEYLFICGIWRMDELFPIWWDEDDFLVPNYWILLPSLIFLSPSLQSALFNIFSYLMTFLLVDHGVLKMAGLFGVWRFFFHIFSNRVLFCFHGWKAEKRWRIYIRYMKNMKSSCLKVDNQSIGLINTCIPK